jgi:hypothetical protein
MTDLREQARMSAHNDSRLVYECLYSYQKPIYQTSAYDDRDIIVGYEYAERVVHIVAVTQKAAEFSWHQHWGDRSNKTKLISCIPICVIDNEINLGRASTW